MEPYNSGVKFTVVAAKIPGEFILRAVKSWTNPEQLQKMLKDYLVVFNEDDIEWTYHEWSVPYYILYGSGDIPRMGFNFSGIFLHRFNKENSKYSEHYNEAKLIKFL